MCLPEIKKSGIMKIDILDPNHSFTNKSWKKHIKELKREDELRIFL